MKLQKILIINRAPFDNLELNFDNEQVIVLSGINGAGKTTVISYIVDALYELAKKGFTQEFENKNTKYYRISSNLFSVDPSKMSAVYLRFKLEDGSSADYIDIRGSCSQDDYDKLIKIPDKIDYSKIEQHLTKNRVEKYWTISDSKKIDNLFLNNLLTYFPAYRYETPYYLNDPYKIQLSFNKDMTFTGYLTNPIEVTSDLPEIANWIMDIVLDQYVYGWAANNVFSELNSILSNILFNKVQCRTRVGIGQRFSGARRIAIMDADDANHQVYPSIFNMSSGELALLCLFVELLKQTDKNMKQISNITGIVLVDEIEKHLHIKLQKEVLPLLFSLFPNIQFITSTHSPFLGLGLSDAGNMAYKIFDLDNNGIPSRPEDNELFEEVYQMMIAENNRYAIKLKELQEQVKNSSKSLVITEGKTDWKHMKAAMKALNIVDLDVEFLEYEDQLGDTTLLQLLNDYARVNNTRKIIGVFDRDNFQNLKCDGLETEEYVSLQNGIYAFAIPLVNEEEYGNEISIEHYYRKCDLTKEDPNGRRLFLGSEFFASGFSKDNHFHTKCKGINRKCENNSIIDDKVFDISKDLEEKTSIALSKNDFAELVLQQDDFAKDFEFSKFNMIFDVLRKIML